VFRIRMARKVVDRVLVSCIEYATVQCADGFDAAKDHHLVDTTNILFILSGALFVAVPSSITYSLTL
jgi:ATP-dependent protease HslVU (ClpYQ) ATPase subunit